MHTYIQQIDTLKTCSRIYCILRVRMIKSWMNNRKPTCMYHYCVESKQITTIVSDAINNSVETRWRPCGGVNNSISNRFSDRQYIVELQCRHGRCEKERIDVTELTSIITYEISNEWKEKYREKSNTRVSNELRGPRKHYATPQFDYLKSTFGFDNMSTCKDDNT